MHYVMSDIHGCKETYMKMLELINFSRDDMLYIDGDVLDRGKNPIGIVTDIISKPNVILIKGNHEDIAINFLRKACEPGNLELLFARKIPKVLNNEIVMWVVNGGDTTMEQLLCLGKAEICSLANYLEGLPEYAEVTVGENDYVIVHAGLDTFSPEKKLDEYATRELVWDEVDYDKVYYPDKYLITGHTPTCFVDKNSDGKIVRKNNHIAIDCGCVFGDKLGCICLETGEEFYVDVLAEDVK